LGTCIDFQNAVPEFKIIFLSICLEVRFNGVPVLKQFFTPVIIGQPFGGIKPLPVKLIAESQFPLFEDIEFVGIFYLKIPDNVRILF
jgi:hypothetical protein